MDILQHPRYQDKPAILFFENYIVDLLGHLPQEKQQYLEDLQLQDIFNTDSVEWHDVVRETLQLSDTIDICVLNRWLLLQEADSKISADDFAKEFVDEYFREGSEVDVWDKGTLVAAISRVQSYYQGNDVEIIPAEDIVDEIFRQANEAIQADYDEETAVANFIEASRPEGLSDTTDQPEIV